MYCNYAQEKNFRLGICWILKIAIYKFAVDDPDLGATVRYHEREMNGSFYPVSSSQTALKYLAKVKMIIIFASGSFPRHCTLSNAL